MLQFNACLHARVCACKRVPAYVCALPRGYLPWSNYRMRKSTPSTSEQTGCQTIRIPQPLLPETPTKSTKNSILSCTTNDSGGGCNHGVCPNVTLQCGTKLIRSKAAALRFFFIMNSARELTPVATFPATGAKVKKKEPQ